MSDGFDTRQLDKLTDELLGIANRDMPKESKKFIRREGNKLRKKTAAAAKAKVKKNTGKYYKSIKRGKVYVYRGNGATATRVYSSAPHGHLIENGHRQVTKDGEELGFVPGKHVFEEAGKAFEGEYNEDVDDFLDDLFW